MMYGVHAYTISPAKSLLPFSLFLSLAWFSVTNNHMHDFVYCVLFLGIALEEPFMAYLSSMDFSLVNQTWPRIKMHNTFLFNSFFTGI
ncbi:hypothetical protein V8C37DRAFT_376362 [Trichoderma ceciliae]